MEPGPAALPHYDAKMGDVAERRDGRIVPAVPAWSANAAELLAKTAEAAPGSLAIADGEQRTAYCELAASAGGIAVALARAGVVPGDRVCLMLPRSADAAAGYFGILAAGAVAVVAHEHLKPRQLSHILEHSRARALVTSDEIASRLPADLTRRRTLLRAGSLPRSAALEPVSRVAGDVAQIIYTSGSTGRPKGVTLSHGNVRAGADAVVSYLGIRADDRLAALLPFSFDYGLNQLLCAVATGATLVIERSPMPHRVAAAVRRQRVTVLAAVPPLWLQLLGVPSFRDQPLQSLRIMTNTGGRIPVEGVRALRAAQPHARLFLMYGLTEAFRSTFLPPEEVDARPDSIGRAIPGAEILVLRDDLTPCRPGEIGQLVHRGPTVALGYWDDPEATERVYRPNPLRPAGTPDTERVVFSGDLVRRDETGALFFVGRGDKMIKSMGYRVGPDEIIEVLHAAGDVLEVVVTAEPHDLKGEQIIAHVVLREDGSLDHLRAYCAREMPAYMQPARFEVRQSLPRTMSGKFDAAAAAASGDSHR